MGLRNTLLMAATMGVAAMGHGQQPFDLDPTFATEIVLQGIGSIAILNDGDLLVSGRIYFNFTPNWLPEYYLLRLDPDGSPDWDNFQGYTGGGGGKLVAWNDRFYVGSGQGMRRVWPDGTLDNDFQGLELDPYIHLLQGGDYHVFPDGRLLITGTHELTDTVRGFNGLYNLIWITPDGRLDTTRIHRHGNGDLSRFRELPDGKFIIGGGLTEFEGHPVGNIIRVHADGTLDTTFSSTASWFWPVCFHPLPNGKVVCGGDVVFSGNDDTLHVFRLLPDGALDPMFNNNLAMWRTYDLDGKAVVSSITPFGPDRYIVTGAFDRVEGQFRGGIAVIDTAGYLLDEPIGVVGCGTFWTGFATIGFIVGIKEAPDGSFYIYGSYHGYSDGTTNDPSQRMVSRLYGLDVGVEEEPLKASGLQVYPNPADGLLHVQWGSVEGPYTLSLFDILGREVLRQDFSAVGQQAELDLKGIASGTYYLHLRDGKRWLAGSKVVVQR